MKFEDAKKIVEAYVEGGMGLVRAVCDGEPSVEDYVAQHNRSMLLDAGEEVAVALRDVASRKPYGFVTCADVQDALRNAGIEVWTVGKEMTSLDLAGIDAEADGRKWYSLGGFTCPPPTGRALYCIDVDEKTGCLEKRVFLHGVLQEIAGILVVFGVLKATGFFIKDAFHSLVECYTVC